MDALKHRRFPRGLLATNPKPSPWVDALADVRDLLRRSEEPLRQVTWHVGHLDMLPLTAGRRTPGTDAYEQGRAAGYAEAVEREREDDATSADDAGTWFTATPGQADVDTYETGFLAGFAAYFEVGRERAAVAPRHPRRRRSHLDRRVGGRRRRVRP